MSQNGTRLSVPLNDREREALEAVCRKEKRSRSMQIALWVRERLEREGLIERTSEVTHAT